ncbi:MAG: hypothetical protein MO852_04895 [Candidatus Devosia euplotis]|nr:hypothetical protein [Candidatus Devosia euplotis]
MVHELTHFSRETKVMELAEILAVSAETLVLSDHLMGENDRSATSFLPPALLEQAADAFFAHPLLSVDGWERAIDAEARIVATAMTALAACPPTRQQCSAAMTRSARCSNAMWRGGGISPAGTRERGGTRGGGNVMALARGPGGGGGGGGGFRFMWRRLDLGGG